MRMLNPVILLWTLYIITYRSEAGPLCKKCQQYSASELDAINTFREYIRIDTSREEHIPYAVDFLIRQANKLDLPFTVYQPAGKPIFVATLIGSNPSLPSIMLNSHMDVVKANEGEWSHDPFGADVDEHGNIYGRGTQDTKDVVIHYLEAIRRLKQDNVTLARTLHVTVMPDEETGGRHGMKTFVKTEEFKNLKIGFALDEGLTSRDESMFATYVDRRPWQMKFVVYGEGGHGYTMPDSTAMEKAQKLINVVMEYRDKQKKIMKTKSSTDYGEYDSININMLNGGLAVNVIPSNMSLAIDLRLSVDADPQEVQKMVNSWVQTAGNKTEVSYFRRETESQATAIDETNPYWITMKNTLNRLGIDIQPIVCPATSDMIYVRNLGIPALGFTTKTNTIPRLHGVDEYVNTDVFLRGIDIYVEILKELGNLPAQPPRNCTNNKNGT